MSGLKLGTIAALAASLGQEIGKARAAGTLTEADRKRLMQLIEDESVEAYATATCPPVIR